MCTFLSSVPGLHDNVVSACTVCVACCATLLYSSTKPHAVYCIQFSVSLKHTPFLQLCSWHILTLRNVVRMWNVTQLSTDVVHFVRARMQIVRSLRTVSSFGMKLVIVMVLSYFGFFSLWVYLVIPCFRGFILLI